MNVFDAISTRRSIRKYKLNSVEKEKLMRILEAGRLSPSANNQQPWQFIVLDTQEAKMKIRDAVSGKWLLDAPIIIVACADPKAGWVRSDGEEYWRVDVAIALENMVLQATEEGLGTCWVAIFDEGALKRVLNIPRQIRVIALTPLGYADEEKGRVTDRKPLENIVRYNQWEAGSGMFSRFGSVFH